MSGRAWSLAAALAAAGAVLGSGGVRSRLNGLRLVAAHAGDARPVRRSLRVAGDGRLSSRRGRDAEAMMRARFSVPAALALELRSGRPLADALAAVAAEHGHLPLVSARLSAAAAAVETGADPAGALLGLGLGRAARRGRAGRALSGLSGGGDPRVWSRDHTAATGALRPTAACVSVGHEAGLPLAELLESVAAAATSAVEVHELARAELAGARASAWLLAALPLAGLALGELVGARPGRFLLLTGPGRLCLLVGAALTGAGWFWTKALTRNLQRELVP